MSDSIQDEPSHPNESEEESDQDSSIAPSLVSDIDYQFQRMKKSKKRQLQRSKSSPKTDSPQAKRLARSDPMTSDKKEEDSILSPNPFQLPPGITHIENMDQEPAREPRTPLIYIREVNNFSLLCKELEKRIGKNNFSCKTLKNQISVKTNSPDGYRATVKYLTEKKALFHTYQMVADKPIRVVIRNLHPSIPPNDIKEALEEEGYSVKNVTPVLGKRLNSTQQREPLPLYFVDLDNADPKSKEIYSLKTLLYTRVKVEEPHKRQELIQCHRCQQFLHSKGYCHHNPKCVKCAGDHLTANCPKPKEAPPTCALCKGTHPANYRGCQVHQELQKKIRGERREANPERRKPLNRPMTTASLPPPPLTRSFAAVTSGRQNQATSEFAISKTLKPDETRPQQEDDTQTVQVLSQPFAKKSRGTLPSYIPPPPSDISSILTTFLGEFQAMLKPIIDLLAPLTTLLTSILPSLLTAPK